MKKLQITMFVLIASFVLNCATQKIYITEETGDARIATKEGTSHFFVAGLGQTKEYSAAQICDERPVVAIETSYSFLDGLLGVITYGIYSPHSYAIYCGKKPKKE
ncbi:Bor family protein [Leptospira bandrabouensis]|uniref:Bor family protein n=1 Tax=Leptospira bandrabouensis TaxID=2484903 RepID=UPI001EEC684C|nr:Bor family protein [Leptospira bandrabouensis]MCG6152594.1 Bor family protein [Leptospira bandrabouensis]